MSDAPRSLVGMRRSNLSPRPMLDLLYVAGSIGFFALMLAYVRGCARLGATAEEGADER